MSVKLMSELNLRDKRVLIREDLNVPVKDGRVTSDARLLAALPTLRLALERGARLMVMSHLGRPTEGQYAAEFSLQPVATHMSGLLKRPVRLVRDWLDEHGVTMAARLMGAEASRVTVAGVVTHRQHPETANGAVFLNLEDESGHVNVIFSKGAWARWSK